jgi:hypothetical protein
MPAELADSEGQGHGSQSTDRLLSQRSDWATPGQVAGRGGNRKIYVTACRVGVMQNAGYGNLMSV